MSATTELVIQTVVVDNSNPAYPNAIIRIYWRLHSKYTDAQGILTKTEREYITNLTPSYDESFISLNEINENTMIGWIKSDLGDKYTDLENLTKQWVLDFATPLDNDHYFYNKETNHWQLQP